MELSCILKEEDKNLAAAEVKWALDGLKAAYDARLTIEDKKKY